MYSVIPILRTQLPCYDEIQNHLKSIDSNRVYSNYGPLHNAFIAQLADNFSCKETNILLTSSGTAALTAVILYYKYSKHNFDDDFKVIVPNWTFAATVQSVIALGGTPILVDVDPITGTLDMNKCRDYLESGGECNMVIPVVPFGNDFDYEGWNSFSLEFDIPCCVDAAAAFFSIKSVDIPICISLHATKGLSSGEGGLIVSKNNDIIANMKSGCNFGFENSRIPVKVGLNLKLSEYHAAIGIASLRKSSSFQQTYKIQYNNYIDLFAEYLCNNSISIFTDALPKTTFSIRNSTDIQNSTLTYECLAKHGFEVRPWWGLPISQTPIAKYCIVDERIDNSLLMSEEVIGLPIGDHIDYQSQLHIVKSIAGIFNR